MKESGAHAFLQQKFRHFFGLPARRAIHDRAAGGVRRQIGQQQLMDMREFFMLRGLHHGKIQIGAIRAAVERHQFDPDFIAEVVDHVGHHIRFGGSGQAQDWRNQTCAIKHLRFLLDEAADIAIIGTKVLPPFRDAMRLVQHPGADFALFQHLAHCFAAQLFRRNNQDTGVAQPYPVQRIAPFRHRQQAIDRHAAGDAARFQSRHLIRHQRHQRRNHYSQRASLVIARQRRNLVAQGFAGAGRQNPQHMLARKRRFHNRLLQRASIGIGRFRAKFVEIEKALQFTPRIVSLAAPVASWVAAGAIAQQPHQRARLWKLMPHPRRHYRIAA